MSSLSQQIQKNPDLKQMNTHEQITFLSSMTEKVPELETLLRKNIATARDSLNLMKDQAIAPPTELEKSIADSSKLLSQLEITKAKLASLKAAAANTKYAGKFSTRANTQTDKTDSPDSGTSSADIETKKQSDQGQ